jgi:hypothetical protein
VGFLEQEFEFYHAQWRGFLKKLEFGIRFLNLILLKNFHAKPQSAQRKIKKLGDLGGFA